jgi:hypothetical protein
VLFIIFRLAFVAKALLPMYFDSAQHYLFAKNILFNLTHADSSSPLPNYYHLGFHFLTAFLTFVTGVQINDSMLVVGQIILAILPFSAFFIVRHWTRSNSAAIFALLLGAFGWYMPAHAMDWGKYPALASLGLTPFVLSIAYLSFQYRQVLSTYKYWGLYLIVFTGALITIFLHSRALIIFAIAGFTAAVVLLWQRLPGVPRLLVVGATILGLIYEINFIQATGVLTLVFDPYGPKGWLVTGAILLLSIFAYPRYSALVFSCMIWIALLLLSLFIPLGNLIPGYANTTLLDRPFVEMVLYFPLTLLGGFGLAALQQTVQEKKMAGDNTSVLPNTIALFFIMLVTVHALFKYDLYPADCCDIASTDDLAAIQWMDKNLPEEAQILIASTALNVLPTDAYQGSAGGDAGTWINPLIDRPTTYMPYNTDFSQPQTLDTLCRLQVDYIYVGKTGSGFDEAGMDAQHNAYTVLFALPNARIYKITGCVIS